MINTLTRVATLGAAMTAAILLTAAPAFSQAPSEAQREAIKSECRSDYMAHCSSIPPGGEASLQCLQKNMASLAPGCQSAVKAVEAPAAPKAESAPAAETAKPAAESAKPAAEPKTSTETTTAAPKAAAAKPPTSAQTSAIRSACRSDYPKVCAGVPTGGAPALQCLEKNKAKLSAGCEKAVAAATGGAATGGGAAAPAAGAAPAAAGAAPAAAAAPVVIVLRPMRPREELFVLRSACGGDVQTICGGVAPGGGRIVQCLATNAARLSPACQDVLSQFRAQ